MAEIRSLEEERCVILHADDFGMCHTTNQAILNLLEKRAITSATLMVNCPWSLEAARAAARNPRLDVGVHLTLTSEWDHYKWGPVLRNGNVDTLVDEFGHFPANTAHMAKADPEQVRSELTAQIELAIRMGVDPTHLDNHMGSLRPDHHELLVELAAQFALPIRFSPNPAHKTGKEALVARLAAERGILHPHEVLSLPFTYAETPDYDSIKQLAIRLLREMKPGLTELLFHPSLDTEELKAITGTWPIRRCEYDLFLDPDVQDVIARERLSLIGWREVRELQRSWRA
ncbi:polysaccharide deacetylase family protein [Paenibacillus doosanensis]|uniref:polysaccharide deacetylase family protein n=1 Tax=Paenibacillus doosanensis TaxID=1229154 RepID=UPI00217F42E9|nr:polysaccharide deacetylase family protein [Paenibacillus doosanensis]MCS7460968.1 polysaccharide deacetylase family protein [Paenibacillus doosanensis]